MRGCENSFFIFHFSFFIFHFSFFIFHFSFFSFQFLDFFPSYSCYSFDSWFTIFAFSELFAFSEQSVIHESNAVSQGFARTLLKEGDHETGQGQAIRSSRPSNGKNQGPKSSFAAECGICTSRTGFVVEPENLRIRWVTYVELY